MYKFSALFCRKTVVLWLILLISFILAGCVNSSTFSLGNSMKPKQRVSDYSSFNCDDIWRLNDEDAYHNALYWLQLMHCTKLLTKTNAQLLLTENKDSGWVTGFKHTILLAHLNTSDNELRQLLEPLAKPNEKLPTTLQTLIQNWVSQQQLRIALNQERVRSQRQRESSEQQTKVLNEELATLQVKLQSLTNIEKQLLSERQPASIPPSDDTASE